MPMPSRRTFLAVAGLTTAASVLHPRAALCDDARIEVSSAWGADSPFQKLVDAFNAEKLGVTLTNRFDGDYETMTAKALAGVAAGRPPALMATGWKFGFYAKRTLGARRLDEIDAARTARIVASFVPSVMPLVTIDGALIGLPWAMSTPITFINLDLWNAGLDPAIPERIDTAWLYARMRDLHTRLEGRHPTYRSALALSNNEWTSQSFIQNAGGFILDADATIGLDRPEAIHGMEEFCRPAHDGLWVPVSAKEQDAAFQAGALACCTTSSTRATLFPFGRFEVATTRFPTIPGHAARMNSGGNFLAVYARNPEQAAAALVFLEFCASAAGQTLWKDVGYLNTSVHPIPLVNRFMAPAAAQLADGLTAETIWPGRRGLEGQDVWRKWVSRMVTREVGIADGLKRAKDELTPLVAA
jgi:multiple sugar transport system substrate-binding protein